MSTRANPTLIGLFIIGGVALAIVGVAVLASGSWFATRSTFISYFDESVNGLEVGASVKFQGVPVGQVTNLLIQIESSDRTFQVPVEYEIDLTRLTSSTGTFLDLENPAVLREQIENGFRAQLQMESIVTGQLYIELAYRTDPSPPELAEGPTRYPEIPTNPSLLSAFGTQAGSVVGDVLTILFRVNEMLEAVNMEELNRSVVASAQAVERLADSDEIRLALAEVPDMTVQLNQTLADVQSLAQKLEGSVDPLQLQVEGTTDELLLTLQSMRQLVTESQGMFSTDSGIGYEMATAMMALQRAAQALSELAMSLERNPDMLLRGKKADDQ